MLEQNNRILTDAGKRALEERVQKMKENPAKNKSWSKIRKSLFDRFGWEK